jgi:hypothetical protein
MRTRYKIHSKGPEYPYFVTSTIVAWIPVFTLKDHFEILAASLAYCRKEKDMRLYAYVVIENHWGREAGASGQGRSQAGAWERGGGVTLGTRRGVTLGTRRGVSLETRGLTESANEAL